MSGRFTSRGIALAGVVAATLLAPRAHGVAQADCPTNHLTVGYYATVETSASVFDSSHTYGSCYGHVGYDLRAGAITATGSAGFAYCGTSSATVSDDFHLEGMPGSAPANFRVVLRVHYKGKLPGSGYADGFAEVREGSLIARAEYDFVEAADTLLRLNLRHSEGEVFTLQFMLGAAGAEGGAVMLVRYEFEGLPPGARVRSCQGYTGVGGLDINQVHVLVPRTGYVAFDPYLGAAGLQYPPGASRDVVFASGLWLSAIVKGELRMAVTDHQDEFAGGAIGDQQPDDPTLPANRVYSLYRTYASALARDLALGEFTAWAVPRGAPSVDVLPSGELSIPCDQMLWHVYNDADPGRHIAFAGSTAPLGVEIRQTVFAFASPLELARAALFSFDIVNRSGQALQDVFCSFWVDADIGGPRDDLAGSDPARQLGYTYNLNNDDSQHGARPPALGVDLLRGPLDPAGIEIRAKAFAAYTGDIRGAVVARYFMNGLMGDGQPFVDPTTGLPTTWVCSGDPTTGNGWIDSGYGDRRMMISTGPFSLAAGEAQTIWFAMIVGDGADRLASVADLKRSDDVVQEFFDNEFDFSTPVVASLVTRQIDSRHVRLAWYAPEVPTAFVDRRTRDVDWARLDTLEADGRNELVLDDQSVMTGRTYGYRLVTTGTTEVLDEIWVEVPETLRFGFIGISANPSAAGWIVEFSLPGPGRATLGLHDVQGRLVQSRDVGDLGPGVHRIEMGPGAPLTAGVYFLRLDGDHGVRTVKALMLKP